MPLTLSDLERLVRKQDPKAWDKLSPQEREDLREKLQHQMNLKLFDENVKKLLGKK